MSAHAGQGGLPHPEALYCWHSSCIPSSFKPLLSATPALAVSQSRNRKSPQKNPSALVGPKINPPPHPNPLCLSAGCRQQQQAVLQLPAPSQAAPDAAATSGSQSHCKAGTACVCPRTRNSTPSLASPRGATLTRPFPPMQPSATGRQPSQSAGAAVCSCNHALTQLLCQ